MTSHKLGDIIEYTDLKGNTWPAIIVTKPEEGGTATLSVFSANGAFTVVNHPLDVDETPVIVDESPDESPEPAHAATVPNDGGTAG